MSSPIFSSAGTQAEFIVVDAADLHAAPDRLSLVAASTIPANGLTALQSLDALALSAGQTLAVTGAAGGVGGYAAELAQLLDLRVLGIGGAQDEAFIAAIGAGFVPRGDDLARRLRELVPDGVDGLIDAAALGEAAIAAVRDGGSFVALIPPAAPSAVRGVRVTQLMLHGDKDQLHRLVALAETNNLTTRVARTLKFEQAAEAHALLAGGGIRGRLVLIP